MNCTRKVKNAGGCQRLDKQRRPKNGGANRKNRDGSGNKRKDAARACDRDQKLRLRDFDCGTSPDWRFIEEHEEIFLTGEERSARLARDARLAREVAQRYDRNMAVIEKQRGYKNGLSEFKHTFAVCAELCLQGRARPKTPLMQQIVQLPLDLQQKVLSMTEPSPFVPGIYVAHYWDEYESRVQVLVIFPGRLTARLATFEHCTTFEHCYYEGEETSHTLGEKHEAWGQFMIKMIKMQIFGLLRDPAFLVDYALDPSLPRHPLHIDGNQIEVKPKESCCGPEEDGLSGRAVQIKDLTDECGVDHCNNNYWVDQHGNYFHARWANWKIPTPGWVIRPDSPWHSGPFYLVAKL